MLNISQLTADAANNFSVLEANFKAVVKNLQGQIAGHIQYINELETFVHSVTGHVANSISTVASLTPANGAPTTFLGKVEAEIKSVVDTVEGDVKAVILKIEGGASPAVNSVETHVASVATVVEADVKAAEGEVVKTARETWLDGQSILGKVETAAKGVVSSIKADTFKIGPATI